MMPKVKPENPPAFPRPANHSQSWMHSHGPQDGMTLRDYFAAKAMTAIVRTYETVTEEIVTNIARDSFKVADAMLAARKAKPHEESQTQGNVAAR